MRKEVEYRDLSCSDGYAFTDNEIYPENEATALSGVFQTYICKEVCGKNNLNCIVRKLGRNAARGAFGGVLEDIKENL